MNRQNARTINEKSKGFRRTSPVGHWEKILGQIELGTADERIMSGALLFDDGDDLKRIPISMSTEVAMPRVRHWQHLRPKPSRSA
jgi:hypothetical protein